MNNYNLRWKILENIIDEHGAGIEKENHGNTFKTYLTNLEFNCDKIESEKINLHTLKFNNILMEFTDKNHK